MVTIPSARLVLLAGAASMLGMPSAATAQGQPPEDALAVQTAGVADSDDGIIRSPKLLSRTPRFVRDAGLDQLDRVKVATAAKQGGYIKVKAVISDRGAAESVTIAESSGNGELDADILAAIQKARFSPGADLDGVRVRSEVTLPFYVGHFPQKLSGDLPSLPQAARDAGHNGKVVVSGAIQPDGTIGDLAVRTSSKSDILDQALQDAVAGWRYEAPVNLLGQPHALRTGWEHNFGAAQETGGSYITGVKDYSCGSFTAEHDWWLSANPDKGSTDFELYKVLGGMIFLATADARTGAAGLQAQSALHKQKWEASLAQCRSTPDRGFMETYRKA